MNYIIGIVSSLLLVFADQFTKYLAETYLRPIRSKAFIPGLIEFYYHTNQGAAFGMLQGGRWFFVALTVVVASAIVYFYKKLPKSGKIYSFMRAAMILIMAGAVGNTIDRAKNGYVVDFLRFLFIDFPIFNVADICLVCGTILMMILIIFFYREKPDDDTPNNSRQS